MKYLVLLFLASTASSQVVRQNGFSNTGNLTVNGTLSVGSYGGTALGFDQTIATATVTGASGYTFPNTLDSSSTYVLDWQAIMTAGSGSEVMLKFNSDTANCSWNGTYTRGATGPTRGNFTGTTGCYLFGPASGIGSGDAGGGSVSFFSASPSSTTVIVVGQGGGMSGGLPESETFTCTCTNMAASLSSAIMTNNAGSLTYTGRLNLKRKQVTFP